MSFFFKKRDVGQTFRNNKQLQEFVLTDVTPTGRKLGTGSYGSVEEVMYKRLTCAGKTLHETLIDVENEGVNEIVGKYLQECQLMSSLRHPNITQFLGLCFLPGSRLPLLVMERLETSLDDLLEHMPNLPLSLKRSVLEDVASGLLYLHERNPPVIHRDLTANNVLLTSSLVAKITDMGNSRIIDMRSGQMARTLSKLPGTLVYMPPEALDDRHRYGPSLDIFSFGHLALFTITQKFPGELLPSTFCTSYNAEVVQGRSEVKRRERYIDMLESLIMPLYPALVELIKQCLHNAPQQRPSTDELLARLQSLKEEVEGKYGGVVVKLDMTKMKLAKELKMKDRRLDELTEQQERCEAKLEEKTRELANAIRRSEESMVLKNQEIARRDHEIARKGQEIEQQSSRVQQLQNEMTRLQLREAKLRTELQSKTAEIRTLRNCQEKRTKVSDSPKLAQDLQLKWRHISDLPFGMRAPIQSVLVEETVYLCRGAGKPVLVAYDVYSAEKWTKLPPYIAWYFSMAAVSNQLVLVGGRERGEVRSNALGVWRADSKEWTYPYPDMPIAREDCSVVVYNNWLVVAGGWDKTKKLSSVDVLNIDTKQWYTGPPTPVAWSSMKTAIVGDTCYFMSGYTGDSGSGTICKTYSAYLPSLMAHLGSCDSSTDDSTEIWKEVPQLPNELATPLSISGSLLAVGGRDQEHNPVSTILLYQPDAGKWVKAGDLPTPRYNCTCTAFSDRGLLMAGGYDGSQHLETVHMALII